ncbi:MFS transporter [Desulfobacca acetoxidans]|uniref:Major facilitator superfamily MFS_1 n=1 Tax=Desulfobacca acetoxidans (strain ATCC 700848 / DSM 11109 / ASRB2) TaxID=880072 RepID=F2NJ64_DESAR|nr:MFS transporter [Desulfobacca acetoxidans]AEB08022.1 major facilitator superfamily MFS_1 [Desulfobacca acetoxidans DSM 11109]
MVRFAASLLVVLLTNVLNRVLIVEYQTPATLVTFIFAFQHLATPSGLIAGYFSDRYYRRGGRRGPFIIGGMVLSASIMPIFPSWGMFFASQPQHPLSFWLGAGLFALFGVGLTVSATAVNALLVDELPEAQRGAGMTLVWLLTLAGFIIGSAFFHYLLPGSQIYRLKAIFWLFTILALAIVLGSVRGVEVESATVSPPTERGATVGIVLQGLSRSSQAVLFFVFLAATVFFLAIQTFILTPFGGEVLLLPVGETAKFGIYTSWGAMLGMGSAYWMQKKWPRWRNKLFLVLSLGLGGTACILLAISSWWPDRPKVEAALWLLGLSKGFFNAGISFLTMSLAHPAFSGVFMGLWNLVSGLALAVGETTGGFCLDQAMRFTGDLGAAYGLVFLGEGLGMLGCLIILKLLNRQRYWRQLAPWLGAASTTKPVVSDNAGSGYN